MSFDEDILPFYVVDNGDTFSACLDTSLKYKFDEFESSGFEGNGYDWESVATVYMEQNDEFVDMIEFNSEAGLFEAFADDFDDIKRFISGFKTCCNDKDSFSELLEEAEEI